MSPRAVAWTVVAVLALLHFFLHVGLGFGARAPDLLTVALLLGARESSMGTAAGLGFGFGLLEDALGVLAFGSNAIAFTIVGAAGAATRDFFVGDSWLFLISYFLVGKWVRDLVHWLLSGDVLRQPFVDHVLVQGAIGAVYATAVAALVVSATGLWRERFQ